MAQQRQRLTAVHIQSSPILRYRIQLGLTVDYLLKRTEGVRSCDQFNGLSPENRTAAEEYIELLRLKQTHEAELRAKMELAEGLVP